jgi:aspartyl-tRNA(Asn)/glutamyl-tRNA(Gln) amidotransferase subunit A
LSGNIQGLKIGIPETFYGEGLDPEVDSGIKTALQMLEDMGAVLLPVDLPGSRFGVAAQWAHIFSEAYTYHQSLFFSQREKYGPAFLRRVMSAALLTPSDLVIAQRLRAQIANEFTHAFKV